MDNTNFETFTNLLKEWKVNSDNEYIIDPINPIPTPSIPKIDFDHKKVKRSIYYLIKNFNVEGFYPFLEMSIDDFVDILLPSFCNKVKTCPVIKVCEENNEDNTQIACKVCKFKFKKYLEEENYETF